MMEAKKIAATEVSYDASLDEYTVHAYVLIPQGNIVPAKRADYFTDDREDALATAQSMRDGNNTPTNY